jgi:pimeloyl-ACP methyl ester carboxylesterase
MLREPGRKSRSMSEPIPFLLIPGLACTPRLYAPQIPALWRLGPVMVADHRTSDTIGGIAQSALAYAPPRFRLVGLSMGGYVAFEILRQAPERVRKLALIDTAARADLPQQAERRKLLIGLVERGRLLEVNDLLWPLLVHERRRDDAALRAVVDEMLIETGSEAFLRQQRALLTRIDSRPNLAAIRPPTLVIVGDSDAITPVKVAEEIADGIPGARLEVVADCGHLATLERPEQVTELLVNWFAG